MSDLGGGDLGESASMTIEAIFDLVVRTNRLTSSTIAVPERHRQKLQDYAAENADDGRKLLLGFNRGSTYRSGGWILDVQTGAKAMTLDRDVFVNGDLDIGTYVHEMVHVGQYAVLGRTGFLISYFGMSAAEIARRLMHREPLNMMRSSPHEEEAYQIESRFMTWLGSHP